MNIVNPINFLGRLSWCNLQINHDRFLAATHDHVRFQQLEHVMKLFVFHQLFVSDFDQQPVTDKVASAISQDWENFRRCIRKRNRP
jgi:hypothetical protein